MMAYFPNGSSGEAYIDQWCRRCRNWREDEEGSDNWGCIVSDLHLIGNYYQFDKTKTGKLWRTVLEHFIPTDKDGFLAECRMFIEKPNGDIPGQTKMF